MASRPTSEEPSYGPNRKSCKNSRSINPRNLSSLIILAALCVGGTAQAQSRGECKSESKAQCANIELEWLDWRGANLAGANFDGANLEFANLANADLRGASFRGANLKWSRLSGADL
jgi:uncharacterized protein YjbI with pentapeptide repeats